MIDVNAQSQLRRDSQLCGSEDERLVTMREMIDSAVTGVHTVCPGIIDAFDAATMTVRVKPSIKKLFYPDGANGVWVDLPVIVDVPLCVMSGKGYALTFPIASGDECLLLFAERAVDNWHDQGEISEQAAKRKHSLCDAFALVGVRSKPNVITNYNTSEVELRSKDAQTRIRLSDSGVHIEQGGNKIDMTSSEIALTATTVKISGKLEVTGDVTSGAISLQHHIHPGVQTGGGVTGVPQ